ncbi:hypothetical protein CDL15_Pgr017257 [Punica granatum]|nr:hypothetical protein CDL15_Pgr017257 [Punica granatum]
MTISSNSRLQSHPQAAEPPTGGLPANFQALQADLDQEVLNALPPDTREKVQAMIRRLEDATVKVVSEEAYGTEG